MIYQEAIPVGTRCKVGPSLSRRVPGLEYSRWPSGPVPTPNRLAITSDTIQGLARLDLKYPRPRTV
jgi:hypothetical protein